MKTERSLNYSVIYISARNAHMTAKHNKAVKRRKSKSNYFLFISFWDYFLHKYKYN